MRARPVRHAEVEDLMARLGGGEDTTGPIAERAGIGGRRTPAPKNGVAKPAPHAVTPQPTTARTRTLARKRARSFDSGLLIYTQTEWGEFERPRTSAGIWG
jgi:hypothetical protein